MKRALLWTLTTVLLATLLAPLVSAGPSPALTASRIALLAPSELAAVTGGCTKRCPAPPPDRTVVDIEWLPVSQVNGPAQQLSYSIIEEYSNVYGTKPIGYEFISSNACRRVVTSGGFGISAGFNVQIGATYHCATNTKLTGSIDPGYRVKIYRGNMRMITTLTAAEYLVWSDGSREASGRTDTGRREETWYRFTPVVAKGN